MPEKSGLFSFNGTPESFKEYIKSWNNFKKPMENITPNIPSADTNTGGGFFDSFNSFMDSNTFKGIGSAAQLGVNIFNAWNGYAMGKKALKEQKAGREALQRQWDIENKRYEEREAERKQANATIGAAASVWERK